MSKKPSHKKKRSRALIVWKRWGDWRKVTIAVVTGLFIAVLLTVQLLPDKVSVQIGDTARADVIAPRYVQYPDYDKTRELRQRIADRVPRAYSAIVGANSEARQAAEEFFDTLTRLHASRDEPLAQRLDVLGRQAQGLPVPLARSALELQPDVIARAKKSAVVLLDAAMSERIVPDTLATAQASVRARASALDPVLPRRLIGEVVALNLAPNHLYNAEETEAARRREMELVPTQYDTITRGDVVLRAGDRVTLSHMTRLKALGLVQERIDLVTAISLTLLAFGLVAVFSLYLYQFHPVVLRSFSNLLLVAVVVCGCLLIFRIGSTALGLRFSGDQLGFIGMLCSALGAMLLAALLCPQIAVFVGVSLALLTSVLVGAELKFAILSIVSSLVGVQAVTKIRNRAGILQAVVVISAVNVVTALVAQGATHANLPDQIWQNVLWAVIGGVGSVMLFVLLAAWLERPFRVTTHLTLLELSDPSHPLLRRLAMEAPGTYHHSIIVGNLSEAAAESIGADGLFCRVASYYHDIGKVIRPHFFVENQSSENHHNNINPSLSSLIVTSHVKDGVELAEEYKLPPPIIAIIREHHGTCLIKYFYHRAVTSGADETAPGLEYQFRYEGPRPQTKESGIIMLADSVEAASRTLEKPTPGRIRDLIERILRDRLSDGQLDECELTFKDLEKIISTMTRSLTSLLHARVEYPAGDTRDLRKLAADGAVDKQAVGSGKALADTPETAAGGFGRPP
ncbi:MAG: receptor with intracellular metal dependent phosphohydrolase, partial [Armatimonadetes bacterium]|nr:receptor with intracellular metal dependent phosphohydrolase [Armatimonadota bacterium]